MDLAKKRMNMFGYVFWGIIGELFLLLDAAYMGLVISGANSPTSIDLVLFILLLVFGVIFRYAAEQYK